jgi:carboxyl-terminal processing protease
VNLTLYAKEDLDLYLQNIRPIVQDVFKQHIEYKEVSPLIMKRAMKLYVYRFDSQQTYLMNSEIKSFLVRSEAEWESAAKSFNKQDYSDFRLLQAAMTSSILRAQEYRKEIKNYLKTASLDSLMQELKAIDLPVSFAKSEEELFEKNQRQYTAWFVDYFVQKGNLTPSDEEREKALLFFEKIKMRREEIYALHLISKEDVCHFSEHILKAMVASLDAHSAYYTNEEAYDIRASLKKQFYGVGVVVKEDADGYFITEIIPKSPASYSEFLRVGDQILAIDGKGVEKFSFRTIMKILQGGEGAPLSLKVKNSVGQIQTVHLTREKIIMEDGRIKSEAIPFSKGNIGYIQIDSFYDNREGVTVERDLREAIHQLSANGPLYGLVLDMRNNLGGFLDQAIKVAGLFIQQGVVVIARYAGDEIHYSRDYDPYTLFQGPIVVLTSKTSASAAEIVAQTLQDYGAAIVVGDERTYGKGSMQMQTITDDSASYYYKVTVGKYYTISGRSTQIEGVKAQIHAPTQYAPYNIGEKFLQFPLSADSLFECQGVKGKKQIQNDLKQFFNLYQQKKNSGWNKILPILVKNSDLRIKGNPDYQAFIELVKSRPEIYEPIAKNRDLSKREAVQILQDMALINLKI